MNVYQRLALVLGLGLAASFGLWGCFEEVENTCESAQDCFEGEGCVSGTCQVLSCPVGSAQCGTACVDFTSDPDNCGSCGVSCGFACNDGECVDASALSVGGRHACAIVEGRRVACWGANDFGQLGRGDSDSSPIPRVIGDLGDVVEISAGLDHTCARRVSGEVQCWGSNSSGQLGTSDTDYGAGVFEAQPQTVARISDATRVSAGARHTCAITSGQSQVRCWGENLEGELGNETFDESPVPTRTTLPAGQVERLEAGWGFTCALIADVLYCWGANDHGQLQRGTNQPASDATPERTRPVSSDAISLGNELGCVLSEPTGLVGCWGRNTSGKLGRGPFSGPGYTAESVESTEAFSSVSVGLGDHACALTLDGTVHCWGSNVDGEIESRTSSDVVASPLALSVKASQVSVGISFTCALLDSGEVACWGRDADGRLGRSTR